MIDLLPDERIDDLQCKGYQIIQNPNMFCFGMDAVLLANFVKHRRDGMYMDLGTGTGVIPILLAAKEPPDGTCQFVGLELRAKERRTQNNLIHYFPDLHLNDL